MKERRHGGIIYKNREKDCGDTIVHDVWEILGETHCSKCESDNFPFDIIKGLIKIYAQKTSS